MNSEKVCPTCRGEVEPIHAGFRATDYTYCPRCDRAVPAKLLVSLHDNNDRPFCERGDYERLGDRS